MLRHNYVTWSKSRRTDLRDPRLLSRESVVAKIQLDELSACLDRGELVVQERKVALYRAVA